MNINLQKKKTFRQWMNDPDKDIDEIVTEFEPDSCPKEVGLLADPSDCYDGNCETCWENAVINDIELKEEEL